MLQNSARLAPVLEALRPSPRLAWARGKPVATRRTYSTPASERLFRDAEREEEAEREAKARAESRGDVNDPIWTGDERLEDTVLRMLMDKYRPLRTPGMNAKREGLDNKLKKVPKPVERHTPVPPPASNAPQPRPHTPPDQPWNAVYVRPTHAGGGEPQIYRGRMPARAVEYETEMSRALKARGVTKEQLPFHDPKAMSNIRSSLKRSMGQERLVRARDQTLEYAGRAPDTNLAQLQKEREQVRKNEQEEAEQQLLMTMLGSTRGLASIADRRIEEARIKGQFAHNSLRGKPLGYDFNEGNPHLGREEFFVYRMVKRQGGAPPFVEMNAQLHAETQSLKQRIQRAFIMRALLQLSSDPKQHTLSPVRVRWAPISENSPRDVADYEFEASTDREHAMIAWARAFRDPEWVRGERGYHDAAVHQLNESVRRYNNIAPASARKLLYDRARFVDSALAEALPFLVEAASARLRGMRPDTAAAAAATSASGTEGPGSSLGATLRAKLAGWFRSA